MKNWLVTFSKDDALIYMTVYAADYDSAFITASDIKYKLYADDVVRLEELV